MDDTYKLFVELEGTHGETTLRRNTESRYSVRTRDGYRRDERETTRACRPVGRRRLSVFSFRFVSLLRLFVSSRCVISLSRLRVFLDSCVSSFCIFDSVIGDFS